MCLYGEGTLALLEWEWLGSGWKPLCASVAGFELFRLSAPHLLASIMCASTELRVDRYGRVVIVSIVSRLPAY